MTIEHQTITTNGIAMHVASKGEGAPVLLLHGFPDTHQVWKAQLDALAGAGYRAIAPDLRGYGKTEAPEAQDAYTLELLGQDVVGLLDALEIDKVRLVGHDWGSVVGWQVAMHAPERVECFAALSVGHPSAFARAGFLQRLKSYYVLVFQVKGAAEALLEAGDFAALGMQAANKAQFADWQRELSKPGRLTAALNYYRANAKMLADPSWPPVKVPVLGIWSEDDVALVEKQMTDSARYVDDDFRYERIDGAGHWVQIQAAKKVNDLLLGFFAEHGTAPRGTN